MKINVLGKKTIASAIIVSAVSFIIFRLGTFGIKVDESTIFKFYYEMQRAYENGIVSQLISQEEMFNYFISILKLLEIEVDKKLIENPEFLDKVLFEYRYLWDWYVSLKKFINFNDLKNSPITEEIEDQIRRKINQDPELLRYKVKRDLDFAIDSYVKQERKNKKINYSLQKEIKSKKYTFEQKQILTDGIYYEFKPDSSYAQSQLGGVMGIRGIWVTPDSREIDTSETGTLNLN